MNIFRVERNEKAFVCKSDLKCCAWLHFSAATATAHTFLAHAAISAGHVLSDCRLTHVYLRSVVLSLFDLGYNIYWEPKAISYHLFLSFFMTIDTRLFVYFKIIFAPSFI